MEPTWLRCVVVFLSCWARWEGQTNNPAAVAQGTGAPKLQTQESSLKCPLSSSKVIRLLLLSIYFTYILNTTQIRTVPATASPQSLIKSLLDHFYNRLQTEHSASTFVPLPKPFSLPEFSNFENFTPLWVKKLSTHLNICILITYKLCILSLSPLCTS